MILLLIKLQMKI